ncbi:hypothetical protein KQ940_00680 [Marinobacterium sp. D7]|uniref:hypothetical protein n=1 Tax=Marinobacterium ramblicola TaxID=2849041 RepID=UPI001C2D39ED|nr:hypothetical protein [Marinobacterium ramblicola]MBV1786566.1 hypothetical protein [Marinobacterium ramblicola]
MLEVFFDSSNNPGLRLESPERAAALLVNLTTEADLQQFLEWYASRPDCPVIAVVSEISAPRGVLELKRPLEVTGLKSMLARVLDDLHKRAVRFPSGGAPEEAKGKTALKMEPVDLKALIAEAGVSAPKPAPKPQPLNTVRDASKSRLIMRWSEAERDTLMRRACGSLPDLDPELPGWSKRILFSLEGRFLDQVNKMVQLAQEQQVPMQVSGIPGAFIYFPDRDLFSYDLDPDLLVQMASSRFGFGELDCHPAELKSPVDPIAKRDQLLWMLGLLTSAGRLPDHLDPAERYRFNGVSDLQRFMLPPQAENIAKAWAVESRSALEIVRLLKLPQRYVFSFMAAADAAGLFERR